MAHRGLRKPSSRRSLRPRNHSTSSGSLRAPSAGASQPVAAARDTETETGTHDVFKRHSEVEDERLSDGVGHGFAMDGDVQDLADPGSDAGGQTGFEETAPSEQQAEAAGGGHASSVAHDDPLANSFFERSEPDEVFDDTYVIHQLSRGSRRAMYASLGIFAVSVVCIGSYTAYQNWIMPAPVELGATVADIPAVPQPTAANAAPTSSRWQSAMLTQPAAAQPSTAAPSAVVPSARGTETQLSAATQPPVEFSIQGAAQGSQAPQAASAQPTQSGSLLAARPVQVPNTKVSSALIAGAAPKAAAAPSQVPTEKAAEPEAHAAAAAEPMQVASAELDQPSGGLPTSASGGPTYDELVAVGRALSKKNKRVEASEAFRRALSQSPQGSAALSGLGFVYLNADEKQNAREYAQRAVLADASNAEGWIVLGAALELLGDRAGAKDAYRNCVERGQGPYLLECRRVAH
jgi:Flp pilus assembly protein TadD